MERSDTSQLRSLATVRDGEALVVEHIVFDGTRAHLAAAGVAEGDRIRCRTATPSYVEIETSDGARVSVDLAWASFVQVSAES